MVGVDRFLLNDCDLEVARREMVRSLLNLDDQAKTSFVEWAKKQYPQCNMSEIIEVVLLTRQFILKSNIEVQTVELFTFEVPEKYDAVKVWWEKFAKENHLNGAQNMFEEFDYIIHCLTNVEDVTAMDVEDTLPRWALFFVDKYLFDRLATPSESRKLSKDMINALNKLKVYKNKSALREFFDEIYKYIDAKYMQENLITLSTVKEEVTQ